MPRPKQVDEPIRVDRDVYLRDPGHYLDQVKPGVALIVTDAASGASTMIAAPSDSEMSNEFE